MATPEPEMSEGNRERSLHDALVKEIHSVLQSAGVGYVLLKGFGLDIAVFVQKGQKDYARFLEVKVYADQRPGAVGVGNGRGKGSQVDLLIHPEPALKVTDPSIRWVLGMASLPKGSPRYAFFSSTRAKAAIMNEVARGKQNNLRVSDFQHELVPWHTLCVELCQFMLGQTQLGKDTD